MTETHKKYEEAARVYTDNLGDDPPDHRGLRSAYKDGATHGHNEAIDIAINQIKLLVTRDGCVHDSDEFIIGRLQKLKI